MVASRKTLVPAVISKSGRAPSAVKKTVLFSEQLADLLSGQGENAPTLRHDPLGAKSCRLAVKVRGERVAHDISDLLALADRLVPGPVVETLFEKGAELPSHGVMTVS